jgi:dTDP-4-dehydrorhamnose reductase
MKQHIVILGANGQLGSDLVAICQQNNISFTPVTQQDFDALTDDLATKVLDGISVVSHIINCIATTNVDGCETDSDLAFNINANFAYKLARLCNERNITLFLQIMYLMELKRSYIQRLMFQIH